MKIRISYPVEVDNDFRSALAHRHGRDGLATREEVFAWFAQNGSSCNDDLMDDWHHAAGEDEEKAPEQFT